jgi:hypothetical protein
VDAGDAYDEGLAVLLVVCSAREGDSQFKKKLKEVVGMIDFGRCIKGCVAPGVSYFIQQKASTLTIP